MITAPANPLNMWLEEAIRGMVSLRFKVTDVLFSGKSAYGQVDVVQTAGHGRMLLIDGTIMLSERDEFVYHEMMAHVPLFSHPDPRRVLIIGGGDGGTAREVLRHRCVEQVVMVEIDAMVVTACREHMPSVAAALDDPRLTLVIDDGVRFAAETTKRFDVVLVDSTDPVGPAEPLFGADFYRSVSRILNDAGIMVTQAESPFYDPNEQRALLGNQRPYFPRLHVYLHTNLTYPGGLWCLGYATKGGCPVAGLDPARVAAAGFETKYYTSGVHRAAFMLPAFIRDNLRSLLDPIEDLFGR